MSELSAADSHLAQAEDRLYQKFAACRGKPNWDDPLDNKSHDDNLSVVRYTVRQLPVEHFAYYGWHAMGFSGGEVAAIKYFFPRVLSEAANPPEYKCDLPNSPLPLPKEMYIDYLNKRNWLEWREPERNAIVDLFLAWFAASLADSHFADYRRERRASFVLRFAAFAQVDIHPFLTQWSHDESLIASLQLAAFIHDQESLLITRATLDGWANIWGSAGVSPDQISHVARFLTSARTYSRIERAFFAATDDSAQKTLASAVATLQNAYVAWHQTLRGTGQIPHWAETVAAEMSQTT